MEEYVYKGKKRLRCGYTTGSCAAAAAKAAAEILLGGHEISETELMTPSGRVLKLDISNIKIASDSVSCSVQKDSGDDPDITNGVYVYAEVFKTKNGIEITGGEGIGMVTKPGLDRPVGDSAINTVPRGMITKAVVQIAEKYGYSGGFKIVVSIPGGEELAKKTFNPRIGIVGGLSVIGTTGIVEPMSDKAIVETIRTEASAKRAQGQKSLLLVVGNYGERFLKENMPKIADKSVMCSNFIGEALDIGVSLGFENILLVGHIGKAAKLGSGIMNTHSSYADGRMETLMACGVMAGVPSDVLCKIDGCVSVDAALDILYEDKAADKLLDVLINRIDFYLRARVKGGAETAAVVFSDKHPVLLKTGKADEIIRALENTED